MQHHRGGQVIDMIQFNHTNIYCIYFPFCAFVFLFKTSFFTHNAMQLPPTQPQIECVLLFAADVA